ncbi:MAG: ABC transporter permease [Acidimicrobiales bacterium]|jgi:molybdate transport system permease protein|nr:ABC transporter permease [Acidimicrobiales bacterium]
MWVLGLAGAAFLVLPLLGLVLRAPWSDLADRLSRPGVTDALRLSLLCATSSTGVALLLGVPLAWLLARQRFPGRTLLRAVVLVPLLLPPVVSGVGLLVALGRRGLLGERLDDWFGVRLPFTTAGVVVAVTYVALPFVVITMEAAFASTDRGLEQAAATLGARPLTVTRTITLPQVLPSLAAGAMLAWARAIGEFGATVTFAGNLQGETQTLPLATFLALETDLDQAILLSLLLLLPTIGLLAVVRSRRPGIGSL